MGKLSKKQKKNLSQHSEKLKPERKKLKSWKTNILKAKNLGKYSEKLNIWKYFLKD